MSYMTRQMTEDDILAVQQLAKISWHHTYAGIIPEDIQNKFLQSAYSSTSLSWRLRQSHAWVCEVEGKIVGFAIYSLLKSNGEVELGAIYLHPNFQGMSMGTALLELAKNQITGLKKISLSVEKDNEKAIEFYKSKGFYIESEFKENFEGHTFNTVRMKLDLP